VTDAAKSEPTVAQLFDLTGRTAMVTGASGHLGGAMARALAEAGARLVIASRELARAEAVAAALPNPHALRHEGVAMDQFDESSIVAAFAAAVDRVGPIHVLVNNAHETLANDWTDVTGEQFTRQLANATGYFLLARAVRNHAVACGVAASVIMLGSMYGVTGSYPQAFAGRRASAAAYHALKGAVVQLTRHLAVYWADDRVRVNCLSPGSFPKLDIPPEQLKPSPWNPMHRIGQPWELKGAVVFLASDASSYVTGHNLLVDGGWTAW
jgi:gluconate 5-dehydrogenase